MRPRNTSYRTNPSVRPRQWPNFLQSQSTLSRSSLSFRAIQRLRQSSFTAKSSLINSSAIHATSANSPQPLKASTRIQRQREALVRIATANAAIAGIVACVACVTISHPYPEIEIIWKPTTVLVYLLGFLSLLQVPVTVSYWRVWLRHEESIRSVLWPSAVPIPRLESSPKSQLKCAFECIVHLLFLYPNCNSTIQSSFLRTGLRAYDLLFLAILLRSYHGVRVWYWRSAASSLRSRFYQDTVSTKSWTAYYLKSTLRTTGLAIALLVCVMGLCALAEFALEVEEKESAEGGIGALETAVYWMTGVGLAEDYPRSVVGRGLLLLYRASGVLCLGVMVGCSRIALRLSASELQFSQELLALPRKYEDQTTSSGSWTSAAVLIQRWWRRIKPPHSILSPPKHSFPPSISGQKCCDSIKSRLDSIRSAFSEASNCALRTTPLSLIVPLTQVNRLLRSQYTLLKKCQFMVFPKAQAPKQLLKGKRLSTIMEEASDRGSSHYRIEPNQYPIA